VLTSDLPSLGAQYWFAGDPWDYTPISEAERYYAALKLLKVESALVRFPGEPHGLSRRPSHQVAKVVYNSTGSTRTSRNPDQCSCESKSLLSMATAVVSRIGRGGRVHAGFETGLNRERELRKRPQLWCFWGWGGNCNLGSLSAISL
jgi:hypothetical protein